MCGICGVAGWRRPPEERERLLLAMRDSIRVRGPDDAGEHLDDTVALAVRRLAILDLSTKAHMPMWDASRRFCIVHNGEIFNYVELRRELEAGGARFRSASDTEVLVELYARRGAAMLPRLNGFFAFAIWDAQDRSLFLARDRVGVKPLYLARHEGALWFASEPKALMAGGVPSRFDEACWEELLCFRFTAGERTPLAGISRLLPGHWLLWRDGQERTRRWWDLGAAIASQRDARVANEAWFTRTFDEAVALRRISDVPVGVLLSGGVDSGSVAASLALQTQEHTATFTVRFDGEGYDESDIAHEVARQFELEYHDLAVPVDGLLDDLRHASVLRDEPLAHVNEVHLWRLSELAKPFVTVLLSGEGADETLGGYVRYHPLRQLDALREAAPAVTAASHALSGNRRMRKMARFLDLADADGLVLFNACDVLPNELRLLGMAPADEFPARRAYLAEGRAAHPCEPVRQAMFLDLHTFLCSLLDRNDRMTMGASIECREPFLDPRLVESLAAAPTHMLFSGWRGKVMLRRTMHDRLPARVLRHRKWGFGVPWSAYFRRSRELRRLIGMLPALEPIRSGPFQRQRVRALVDAFLAGDDTNEALIFQLAMIAIWYDAYLGGAR